MHRRELLLQYQIRHPHVLAVKGISYMGDKMGIVMDYLENGNLFNYLKAHRDANRLLLVSYFRLLHFH